VSQEHSEPEGRGAEAAGARSEAGARGAAQSGGRQHRNLAVSPPPLDVDRLIDDRRTRVIVCCGSGGVGKTTTAAAIGLRAAERGRHVVVLTVDPARRLAQSMGLTSLDNTPRPVPFTERGEDDQARDGTLHAMMLDMKRTFDEIVEAHADPDRAAQILANPFYQSLSSGFSGTQEYMAMEKLGQLRRADEWDLIVVDTPPSRSALDFLDAPQRLGRFLDGRLIRLLVVPAKVGGRAYLKVLNAGFGMVTGVLTRVLGAQVLRDVQTFVSALDTMFGGFRERADYTYRLLRAPGTAFLVIAAPEPDALREASYFVERLAQEGMPLAGLILNRVHGSPAARLSAARSLAAAETLQAADNGSSGDGSADYGAADYGAADYGAADYGAADYGAADYGAAAEHGPHALAIAALRLHAERMQLTAAERRVSEHFTTAHPHVPVAEVPDLADDVHDLAGLRAVGDSFRSR
jgi:anion-transporting  ArsA/GET3 family ATPase